ncbi:hypothetical protein MW887_010851 [Aspergillus wentii]|nr:hypothetical protein MW887_010851 [Aspergillus wentii]
MVGLTNTEHPLRLLALDGGGVRGLSELIIIHQLMLRIQRQNNLRSTPKPCDIFDLIGGTSTGGLVAIMLGRLKLSIEEAIDEFRSLAKDVFGERKPIGSDGRFKATNLENAIRSLVGRFVCAKDARDVSRTQLYRSYSCDASDENLDVTICEAARATSAAPTFFKRKKIGAPDREGEFVDGVMGSNNPVKLVLTEAQRIFPPDRPVSCIVSIGTGKKYISQVKSPSLLQRIIPISLIMAVKDMTTDCEAVAEEMERRFANVPVYFRFNVEHGLQSVGLGEYKQLGNIKAQTIQYLGAFATDQKTTQVADGLYNDIQGRCLVSDLA